MVKLKQTIRVREKNQQGCNTLTVYQFRTKFDTGHILSDRFLRTFLQCIKDAKYGKIMSLYGKIQVSEKPLSGMFYAVICL